VQTSHVTKYTHVHNWKYWRYIQLLSPEQYEPVYDKNDKTKLIGVAERDPMCNFDGNALLVNVATTPSHKIPVSKINNTPLQGSWTFHVTFPGDPTQLGEISGVILPDGMDLSTS